MLAPALAAFSELVAARPDDAGIRVVLAETQASSAHAEYRAGLFARAQSSYAAALGQATRVIRAVPASRVAWKVAADVLRGLAQLGPAPETLAATLVLARSLLAVLVQEQVDSKLPDINLVTTSLVGRQLSDEATFLAAASAALAGLAILAGKLRVELEMQNSVSLGSAWLDLGLALAQYPRSADSILPLDQAIRALKFALHHEPVNAIFWNALGVLSFSVSPRLAQHSLIKSIEYNSRTAVPWTNLGLLYVVQGDHDLANQAFLKAQVLEPDRIEAWVGQSTLASLAGHVTEAAALYEHAFSLPGYCAEADLGFATSKFAGRVRHEAAAIDRGLATAAPLFALSRYLAVKPLDATALHLNALWLERAGDLPAAGAALEQAATLLEQLYEVDESPAVESQFVMAQTNLARVRLANLDYAGALSAYEAALSLLDAEAGDRDEQVSGGLLKSQLISLLLQCRLGSGIAHSFLGDPSTAMEALEAGLDDMETLGGERTDLDLALGRIHWLQSESEEQDLAISCFLDIPNV